MTLCPHGQALVGPVTETAAEVHTDARLADCDECERSQTRAESARFAGPAEVVHHVAHIFGVTADRLRGPGRREEIVAARHAVFLVLRRRGMSYPLIGKLLRKDHSTVICGCRRALRLAAGNAHYRALVERALEAAQ